MQAVAAGEEVLINPDLDEQGKANSKGDKAFHRHHQLGICPGHFKRDHQQGHGEGKDGISESLNPGNFTALPAKMLLTGNYVVSQVSVHCAIASMTAGDGTSLPNSPSQRAITAVAKQLPITLTIVRTMSMS